MIVARPLAPSTVLVLAVNSLQQFIMDIVPCLKPIPIREYQERMSVSYRLARIHLSMTSVPCAFCL